MENGEHLSNGLNVNQNEGDNKQRKYKQTAIAKKPKRPRVDSNQTKSSVFEPKTKFFSKQDDSECFADYVAMELKSLRSESLRAKLKLEIRKVITRISEEDWDNTYSSMSSKVVLKKESLKALPQ